MWKFKVRRVRLYQKHQITHSKMTIVILNDTRDILDIYWEMIDWFYTKCVHSAYTMYKKVLLKREKKEKQLCYLTKVRVDFWIYHNDRISFINAILKNKHPTLSCCYVFFFFLQINNKLIIVKMGISLHDASLEQSPVRLSYTWIFTLAYCWCAIITNLHLLTK